MRSDARHGAVKPPMSLVRAIIFSGHSPSATVAISALAGVFSSSTPVSSVLGLCSRMSMLLITGIFTGLSVISSSTDAYSLCGAVLKQRQLKYPIAVITGPGYALPVRSLSHCRLASAWDYIRQLGTNGLVLFGLLYFLAGCHDADVAHRHTRRHGLRILAVIRCSIALAALSASVATLLGRHAFRELVMAS